MTVLQALDGYYHRMAARGEAEPQGYSREKISFTIVLSAEGKPLRRIDLREKSRRRLVPRLLEVPAAVKRTAGVSSNLFWDKTSYVFGRTAGEGRRTAEEHTAFKKANLDLIAGSNDEGMVAFRRFLEDWVPSRFDEPPFEQDMLDTNIVFALDGDLRRLDEREAARRLIEARVGGGTDLRMCLVTGVEAPVARLHRLIKGVEGAQTAGAALVSFNLDAFKSYGNEQGDNAPTSEAAAFRYGAALNRMLDRGSRNRLPRPLGDATVVFWADTSDTVEEAAAAAAEDMFAGLAEPPPTDTEEAAQIRDALKILAAGRPVSDVDPRLVPGTRFHVLGLSPNAARLSVRYWLSDEFETFARRLAAHYADLQIEPVPWARPPSVNFLLVKTTALQEKFDNIPPLLAGEVMRSVLTGGRYPQMLLNAAIIRLRAGDNPGSGWHAAAIRAVLARKHRLVHQHEPDFDPTKEPPMSLARSHTNRGYQIGRLFAVFELAQRAALGRGVNSTIRDKYFGAASAAPASIFPLIITNGQNHLSKIRKEKPGWANLIEKELEEIFDKIEPSIPVSLPRSLNLEDQGEFAIGYYHQRRARLGDNAINQPSFEELVEEGDVDE
jgi:CRISPR-associated protein Csd1